LKLRYGERGGVSPLILWIKSFELGCLVNSRKFVRSNYFAVPRTKNQGAYAAPLATFIQNSVTPKARREPRPPVFGSVFADPWTLTF
jgi:hypothetical protein